MIGNIILLVNRVLYKKGEQLSELEIEMQKLLIIDYRFIFCLKTKRKHCFMTLNR
jgi:hypothetical protein